MQHCNSMKIYETLLVENIYIHIILFVSIKKKLYEDTEYVKETDVIKMKRQIRH